MGPISCFSGQTYIWFKVENNRHLPCQVYRRLSIDDERCFVNISLIIWNDCPIHVIIVLYCFAQYWTNTLKTMLACYHSKKHITIQRNPPNTFNFNKIRHSLNFFSANHTKENFLTTDKEISHYKSFISLEIFPNLSHMLTS